MPFQGVIVDEKTKKVVWRGPIQQHRENALNDVRAQRSVWGARKNVHYTVQVVK